MIEAIFGATLAVATYLILRRPQPDMQLNAYRGLMAIIVLIYPAYALLEGAWVALAWHSAMAVVFTFLIWRSMAMGLLGIAVLLILHANFDFLLHHFIPHGVGPDWYPIACVGYDLVLSGIILADIYLRKTRV